jgi:hypothetical protein
MDKPHGGLHLDNRYQALVVNVVFKLINNHIAKETPYKYTFHLLADKTTTRASTLTERQVFISKALF